MWQRSALGIILAVAAAAGLARAAEPAGADIAREEVDDVLDFGLEDLLDVDVRVAAKKSQVLADVAAAVSVLSVEDVRRSGHTRQRRAARECHRDPAHPHPGGRCYWHPGIRSHQSKRRLTADPV